MLTAEQCQAESINVTFPEENRLEGGLGKAITLRRTELNLKRREFAERAHLSYPYISEIENGVKEPSAKALRQIAEALGWSVADLANLSQRLEISPDDPDSILLSSAPQSGTYRASAGIDEGRQSPSSDQAQAGQTPSSSNAPGVVGLERGHVPSDTPRSGGDPGLTSAIVQEVTTAVSDLLSRWVRDEMPELIRREIARQGVQGTTSEPRPG